LALLSEIETRASQSSYNAVIYSLREHRLKLKLLKLQVAASSFVAGTMLNNHGYINNKNFTVD